MVKVSTVKWEQISATKYNFVGTILSITRLCIKTEYSHHGSD